MRRPVLIVEDDADVRGSLRELLEFEGYQTYTAEHGRAALDRLREGLDPGVILLDWMMPVMNGKEFLASLDGQWNPKTPIVVMTAYTGSIDSNKVTRVLRKPVDAEQLLAIVKSYCDLDPTSAHAV